MNIRAYVFTRCPECEQQLNSWATLSGRPEYSAFWSDGELEDRNPAPPALCQCPSCQVTFWSLETNWDESVDHEAALEIQEGAPKDYWSAVFSESKGGQQVQERTRRLLLWRRDNDIYWHRGNNRYPAEEVDATVQLPLSEAKRADNLKRLLDMVDGANFEEQFLRAELLRHLGHYEDAHVVLRNMAAPNVLASTIAALIRSCEQRYPGVHLLWKAPRDYKGFADTPEWIREFVRRAPR